MKHRPLVVGLGSLVAASAIGGLIAVGLTSSTTSAPHTPKVAVIQRSDATTPTTLPDPAPTSTTAPQTSPQGSPAAPETAPLAPPSSTPVTTAPVAPQAVTPTTVGTVTVPNVIGMTEAAAEAAITGVGLTPDTTGTSCQSQSIVTRETPPPGDTAASGLVTIDCS